MRMVKPGVDEVLKVVLLNLVKTRFWRWVWL